MSPLTIAAAAGVGLLASELLADADYPPVFADNVDSPPMNNREFNLTAFLAVIRRGESSDNYTAKVGGGNFSSFADHPANTGEFPGIRRADGRLTTAAGAYQITRTTWNDIQRTQRLSDFSPRNQDQAAIFLIDRRGAMEAVLSGNVGYACQLLRNEWEIFQNHYSDTNKVAALFENFGGTVA